MVLKKVSSYDLMRNIAVVKFPDDFSQKNKKIFAEDLLKKNKSVKTVLEKVGKVKGRLRKITTKHIAGEKTKEVLYRENGCVFRFDVDTTYFSPRLSNERKEIASKIKKGESVLVMFAGVAPFSIVIARNSRAKRVVSNEINKIANKYAKLNVELNKVKDRVEVLKGDIKKIVPKLKEKYEVIVMPRPQLKESFLEQAFALSKKNTRIYYYDFCDIGKEKQIVEMIQAQAKKHKKKIKILKTKKAGEVAPYRIRLRVDLKVV